MNANSLRPCVTLFLVAVGFVLIVPAMAGELEPTAPPGPTMKTLQQVQPRTPIQSLSGDPNSQYIIDAPGSYYLTDNITGAPDKNGIDIRSDDVVIDLCGFTLIGNTGFYDGIKVLPYPFPQRKNIVVKNGAVSGWEDGIDLTNTINVQLANVRATNNVGKGIWLEDNCQVVDCIAESNGGHGIEAQGHGSVFRNCLARLNQYSGIRAYQGSTIIGCTATRNNFIGFEVNFNSMILDCTAQENYRGIDTVGICTVMRCSAISNFSIGILTRSLTVIKDCNASNNGEEGIYVVCCGMGCRVESNMVVNNLYGIRVEDHVDVHSHIILKNTAHSNTTSNYDIATGNAYGPIIDVGGAGDGHGASVATALAHFVHHRPHGQAPGHEPDGRPGEPDERNET